MYVPILVRPPYLSTPYSICSFSLPIPPLSSAVSSSPREVDKKTIAYLLVCNIFRIFANVIENS